MGGRCRLDGGIGLVETSWLWFRGMACAIRSGDIGGEAIDDINQESEPSLTDVCKVPKKKKKNSSHSAFDSVD